MGRIIVIAGTDTGIGKTWVGCRLAAHLKRTGVDIRAVKLAESGTPVDLSDGEDGVLLACAASQSVPKAALRRYRTPVAVAEAADREGVPFDLEAVISEVRDFADAAELTLLEGAGGLLAPLTWKRSLLDVVRLLGADVVVVAADRLGTLNHTLLTAMALSLTSAPPLGVVLNALPDADRNDASFGQNAKALRQSAVGLQVVETSSLEWEAVVTAWITAES
jgi:dethiobiotin synthetase